ncbi:class I SAM-dependent methyltransferase [Desulforhopalus sp. IMCC35007]|uniref:class I SAM-dependent methyltransferase n=1 Tax=Desulforhopalus sp. IMCC35007 TaxID=2569543 RepID=UPI0010ADAA47|nr:class I SAM-dependent methyltransferase [Desulforhopalus sp. IMCC35007]TKB12213.1 class I SAM-dependent methyltransferase [Desulforhopalus sp. IMCC35007]
MVHSTTQTYEDIDWSLLRKNAMARKGWKRKSPKEWDSKASSFSSRIKKNDYVDHFIRELPLDQSYSVLDIGAGPGTLAIPIAHQVQKVTAIDFSPGMLEILNQNAAQENIYNIETIQCAWEDDWQAKGITSHDIAIASRSVGVEDLESSLKKINAFAKKYVFISDRIGATPFEAEAFRAIGRPFDPGPDYIYTVNLLYKIGIYPNITVLRPNPVTLYGSIEEALASYRWMFQDLSTTEEQLLLEYVEQNIIKTSDNGISVRRNSPIQWALIWWQKQDTPLRSIAPDEILIR